jgi:hypothetical protein
MVYNVYAETFIHSDTHRHEVAQGIRNMLLGIYMR